MSGPDNFVAAPPAAPGFNTVVCPQCGCSQFVTARKLTVIGKTLLIIGIVILVASIPLAFFGIGFCSMFFGLIALVIASAFCRGFVNVCVNCRKKF